MIGDQFMQQARAPQQPRQQYQAPRGAGIEPSVRSIGNSYNNTITRRSMASIRQAHHQQSTMALIRSHQVTTLESVDWFNNRQLLDRIGNIPQ